MTLSDRLNCPDCQGRLTSASVGHLMCDSCGRGFAVIGGVVDLVGERDPAGPDRYLGVSQQHGLLAADLPTRIKSAAEGLWLPSLGDTIEIGCGLGAITQSILTTETVRSLLVIDSDPTALQACRTRVGHIAPETPILFAAVSGDLAAIRDTVADTVIGSTALAGITDTRAFLTRIHRVLKISGHAAFVVPNRRYYQAVCVAMAEALAQHFARDRRWPEGCGPVLALLGEIRRSILHGEDPQTRNALCARHLVLRDSLEDVGHEVGFDSIEVIPLDPDAAGGQTITRLCQDAGASVEFAREFGPIAATVGRPCLSLLDRRDASAFSLVWLTKAARPSVRMFTNRQSGPSLVYVGPDAAVGGVMPRWSIELHARDTQDGVVVTIGGWSLANIDALWVRVTLDSVERQAAVCHPRPDVHEVLNRSHVYHPMHAICSGMRAELLFADVHPGQEGCPLRLEIVLSGGLVVTAPSPDWLKMDQPTVIAH
jgi:SAM-dependent methyltransferase